MFASNAVAYYENGAFRLKLVLMILAAVNMLYFELVTFSRRGHLGERREAVFHRSPRRGGLDGVVVWGDRDGAVDWVLAIESRSAAGRRA